MTIDQKTADEIARRFQDASSLCNSSLRTVMANEGLGQVQVYGRLVGHFMGNAFTNILGPIWKKFPELEPDHMKTPYVEPVPTLSAESQSALRAFLVEARAATDFVKAGVSAEDYEQLFAFGGLAEVEDTIAAIESFLEIPRFREAEK